MRDFFRSFSVNTLGIAVIVAGLIVIVASDPPKTLCDAELVNFKKGMRGFMYPDPQRKIYEGSYHEDRKVCFERNSPGACVGYFDGLRHMLDVASAVSQDCQPTLGEDPDFRNVLMRSLDLMIRLAWGPERPPTTPALKNGWLNPSDVYLYCRMKNRATLTYGEPAWEQFRERYFTELPGAKSLTRQEVWDKSLLSTRCESL